MLAGVVEAAGRDVEAETIEEVGDAVGIVGDDTGRDGGNDVAFFRAPFLGEETSFKYVSCVRPSWPAAWISSKDFFHRGESSGSNLSMSGSWTKGRELSPHGAPSARQASKRRAVLHRACSETSANTRSR